MGTQPIPYQTPSWTQQEATNVSNSSTVPSGGESNPVLASLAGAMKQAQAAVQASAKRLQDTPPYIQGHSATPTLPQQGMGAQLFPNSSVKNLQNEHPQTVPGARNKAIGQIAAQAGSLVGAFLKKREAQKTQQLAMDLNQSLELTKGIDEAQAILQQDPNNAQAKMTLQKNQALLANLLSDPKRAKAIGKAYDVTFGEGAANGGKLNKTDAQAKQAMTGAMRAAQLQQSMPGRMQINPSYQAAQAQLQALQKQAADLTKTYTTMADTVIREQGQTQRNAATNQARVDAANVTAQGKLTAESQRARDEVVLNQQRHQQRLQEIGAEGANRLQAIKLAGSIQKKQEMAKAWHANVTTQLDNNQRAIDQLVVELNKPENKQSTNPDSYDRLIQTKNQLIDERKKLQSEQDKSLMYMMNDPDAVGVFNLTNNSDDK